MRLVLVATTVFLLAGCAAPRPETSQDPAASDGAIGLGAAAPVVLTFATGDFEATTTFAGSFAATDTCTPLPTGCAAIEEFDLTDLVPADAPVELTVTVHAPPGASADFVSEDVTFSQGSIESQSGQINLAAKLVRGSSGSIRISVERPFAFGFPPSADPEPVTGEARSVVRAGVLPSFTPAALKLAPGDNLSLTGEDIEEMILIPPQGKTLRDVDAPFNITLPADAARGDYVLFMRGAGSAQVQGPNITMTAKRMTRTEGAPHDLVAGNNDWTFDATPAPLQVGVVLRSKPTAAGASALPDSGSFDLSVTTPGNVAVVKLSQNCAPSPICDFALIGSSMDTYFSGFLDEQLVPGTYSVALAMQAPRDLQAYEFILQVL